MSLLRADGLVVTGVGAPVIRALDLHVSPGRVFGLVGESGAGKSMIGRAVAGMLPDGFRITAGRLTFAGEDLVGIPPSRRRALLGRRIAFIPQLPMTALNPVRGIGAQMAEHLAHAGIPRAERRAQALHLLAAVGLPDPPAILRRVPHQLSGGQCQRVLIAMAFASRPALVVADEPTTALDAYTQTRIVALIRTMQARDNTAILFITHDLRLATEICDDVAVLYAGAVVERGPAGTVLNHPAHPYTRCLKLANPGLSRPTAGLFVLPDQAPSLAALRVMQGCRFAPRCPVATPDCYQNEPVAAHSVACLHPERTASIAPPPHAEAAPIAQGPPRLLAQNLTRHYRTGPFLRRHTFVALHDATFTVAAGEFVGIVGESGSGKSTLARIVAGLDAPTSGTLRRPSTQLVFQDPLSALNPRRRIASIVTQAIETTASAAQRMARARDLLADLGLPAELAPRRPAQLSGGQRQRVNIARALCITPDLLVADEIVSGLDVSIQAQLLALLQRLRAEHGFSLLFISHDMAVVRHLCERVIVMQQGRIVEQGPTEQVFANPNHQTTRNLLGNTLL